MNSRIPADVQILIDLDFERYELLYNKSLGHPDLEDAITNAKRYYELIQKNIKAYAKAPKDQHEEILCILHKNRVDLRIRLNELESAFTAQPA